MSALDAQVGSLVFEEAIMKRLINQLKKTVILVTHHLHLLPHAHHVGHIIILCSLCLLDVYLFVCLFSLFVCLCPTVSSLCLSVFWSGCLSDCLFCLSVTLPVC